MEKVKQALGWGTAALTTGYLGWLSYMKPIEPSSQYFSKGEVGVITTAMLFGAPMLLFKCIDAVKHPKTAVLGTYVSTMAALTFLDNQAQAYTIDHETLRHLYPAVAGAFPLAAYTAISFAKETIPPHFRNAVKKHWHNLVYSITRNKSHLEKALDACKPAEAQAVRAALQVSEGNIEQGLLAYGKALDAFAEEARLPSWDDRLAERMARSSVMQALWNANGKNKIDSDSPANNLYRAFSELLGLDIDAALQRFGRLGQQTLELRTVSALATEAVAKHQATIEAVAPEKHIHNLTERLQRQYGAKPLNELLEAKAGDEWQRVITVIAENPELATSFESIGGHPVYRIGFNEFLKLVLKFRSGTKEALERTKASIQQQNAILQGEYKTIEPVGLIQVGEQWYLAERYKPDKVLPEAYAETRNSDLYRQAADSMALIHARAPCTYPDKTRDDYKQELEARLGAAPDELHDDIMRALVPLLRCLPTKVVLDTDRHDRNFLAADDGSISLIDLEERGGTPPAFELTKLLYRNAFDLNRDEMVYAYADSSDKLGADIGFVQIFDAVQHAVPYKAVNYWLYAQAHPEQQRTARAFLSHVPIIEGSGKLHSSEKRRILKLADRLHDHSARA